MKQDNLIRHAIDERLSSVHFNAKNQRAVLRAVRDDAQIRMDSAKGQPRFQFALSAAIALLLLLPLGLLTLRISGTGVTASPGVDLIIPVSTPSSPAYPSVQSSLVSLTQEESEAVRAARACFDAVCDTNVFTFDEYALQISLAETGQGSRAYTIHMTSLYDNGCAFSVTVAMPQGEVMYHSTPSLATVPAYVSSGTPEISQWHSQYGPHLITWPQDAQAEFSRRYEGAILRTAREGEMTAAQAVTLATDLVRKHLPVQDGIALYGYSQLYAEKAGKDGFARYVVSVYASAVTDEELPETLGTVSFKTDGSDVVVTLHK